MTSKLKAFFISKRRLKKVRLGFKRNSNREKELAKKGCLEDSQAEPQTRLPDLMHQTRRRAKYRLIAYNLHMISKFWNAVNAFGNLEVNTKAGPNLTRRNVHTPYFSNWNTIQLSEIFQSCNSKASVMLFLQLFHSVFQTSFNKFLLSRANLRPSNMTIVFPLPLCLNMKKPYNLNFLK